MVYRGLCALDSKTSTKREEMTSPVRLAPWSLWINDGTPYRQTTSSTNIVAKLSASVDRRAKASTHLLKMSVTTRMYFFPLEEVGSGPMMSQDIFSNGQVVLIIPKGA